MKVTDGVLKAFYVFFTHRAGASRKMGRHAMDVATAEFAGQASATTEQAAQATATAESAGQPAATA